MGLVSLDVEVVDGEVLDVLHLPLDLNRRERVRLALKLEKGRGRDSQ